MVYAEGETRLKGQDVSNLDDSYRSVVKTYIDFTKLMDYYSKQQGRTGMDPVTQKYEAKADRLTKDSLKELEQYKNRADNFGSTTVKEGKAFDKASQELKTMENRQLSELAGLQQQQLYSPEYKQKTVNSMLKTMQQRNAELYRSLEKIFT